MNNVKMTRETPEVRSDKRRRRRRKGKATATATATVIERIIHRIKNIGRNSQKVAADIYYNSTL